jgi:hypothetical protein
LRQAFSRPHLPRALPAAPRHFNEASNRVTPRRTIRIARPIRPTIPTARTLRRNRGILTIARGPRLRSQIQAIRRRLQPRRLPAVPTIPILPAVRIILRRRAGRIAQRRRADLRRLLRPVRIIPIRRAGLRRLLRRRRTADWRSSRRDSIRE